MTTSQKIRLATAIGGLAFLALPSAATAFTSSNANHVLTIGANGPEKLEIRCPVVNSAGTATATAATFSSSYYDCIGRFSGRTSFSPFPAGVFVTGAWSAVASGSGATSPATVSLTSPGVFAVDGYGSPILGSCFQVSVPQGPFVGSSRTGSVWSLNLTGISWSATGVCAGIMGASSGTDGTYIGDVAT